MPERDSRSTHIRMISRSLISIMVVICFFQLISYGLVISRSLENIELARQLSLYDDINRSLFVATDQIARECNLSQSILAERQPITQAQRAQMTRYRTEADRQFSDAIDKISQQKNINAQMVTTPLRDRWQHFQSLRKDIDRRLTSPSAFTDETLSYELSLASSDLMGKTDLAVHELTRKLGSAQDESIGRLAAASYLLWQIRNQVADDGSALIVRAQIQRPLNTSSEASLDSARELAENFMIQLQAEMRFLKQFPMGYNASDLALEIGRFHALTREQQRALGQGQQPPLSTDGYRQKTGVVQDRLLALFNRLSDTTNAQIAGASQQATHRFLRYSLFLVIAIALNLTLLVWLRRRVLRPLSLLSTIHDAAREAIFLVNASGRIFMANSGAELLFGRSSRELRAMHIAALLPQLQLTPQKLEQLAQSTEEIQARAEGADGQLFHISLIASPLVLENDLPGTLLIIRDDNARHDAEEANRQSLSVLSEITRIQNLLFSQLSRHRVFNEVLDVLLAYTHSDTGYLLEIRESAEGRMFRCRASKGLEQDMAYEADSLLVERLHRQLQQVPGWMQFPVALQDEQSGIVCIYHPVFETSSEALEPLLGLYSGVLGFVSEEEWRKQSANQLHEVLREQEALFSASPAGLIEIDSQARIVRTNHHASRIFGVDEDAMPQLALEQLLNSDSAWEQLKQRITRIQEGKPAAACELECRNRAGTLIWVLFEIRALHAEEPQEGMILSCIDITTLKNTERALRDARDIAAQARGQLAAAIEAIPEAFAFYDAEDCLVVCNQHYANLFFADFVAEQMIGQTFSTLVRFSVEHGREVMEDGYDLDSWIAERTRLHRLEQATFLLQIGERWYQASDHQIEGLGSVCLRADVTELKAQELELRRATVKADEANQAKSAFLASISHEIRTPLNGILGLLELLRLTRLDNGQQDTLASIQESSQTLLRLIDDILDFSKIEAGKLDLNPEPTDLHPILNRVHELYQEMAASKGLAFELVIDPDLAHGHLADPLRLRQILQNFVSNALKFTQQGGVALEVQVLDGDEAQQTLLFSCKDSGIGISAESMATLFRPFTQAESSTTRRFGGTGLGLAICKRLAEQMGGTVALDSIPEQGTTASFRVELPVAALPESHPAPSTSNPIIEPGPENALQLSPDSAPILFVEDNPTNRKLTMMQLERIGVACEVAENGQEAFEMWQQRPYSLVLTDCHMPVMDGHQLAQAIRREEAQHANQRPIPIIACTANIGQDEANRAIAAGMNQVLTKPIGLEPLRAMLTTWLGNSLVTAAEAVNAPQPAEEQEQAVDRATLEIYSQGDLEIELGILQDFISSEVEDMQALETAVNDANHKDARWYTHRIKGAGRMVGALPLANAAEALENCAKQEQPLAEAFVRLRQAFAEVQAWIAQHRPG